MNRRNFVQQGSVAGTYFLLQPPLMMKSFSGHIGVQLWSVRDVADLDPKGTLEQLVSIGYPEVEGYNYRDGHFYSFTPKAFNQLLDDIGIKMTSAHTGITLDHWDRSRRTINDLAQKTIEDHAAIGVRQLICPSIDEPWRSPTSLEVYGEIFNQMGEACKKAGIQFGYHNHDFDFSQVEGKALIDYLLEKTDPSLVIWEMDLYWVTFAHEDPVSWINRYGSRIQAFHVKDMARSPKRESIEVGAGIIDFETIFKLPAAANVKYYIVELEDYRTTSLQGVAESLPPLKRLVNKM
jgi:sugar phosphate isomerase/epimerase